MYKELITFFVSILFHEVAHILVAIICTRNNLYQKKDYVITLTLFGGIASLDEYSMTKYTRFLVYIAGPLCNLILICSAGIFNNSWKYLIQRFNVLMFIFSILPIYPLDGYKILKNFHINTNKKALKVVSIISLCAFFIISIVLKSLGLVMIALYLFFQNIKRREDSQRLYDIFSCYKRLNSV